MSGLPRVVSRVLRAYSSGACGAFFFRRGRALGASFYTPARIRVGARFSRASRETDSSRRDGHAKAYFIRIIIPILTCVWRPVRISEMLSSARSSGGAGHAHTRDVSQQAGEKCLLTREAGVAFISGICRTPICSSLVVSRAACSAQRILIIYELLPRGLLIES